MPTPPTLADAHRAHLATRQTVLKCSPKTTNALAYIRYVYPLAEPTTTEQPGSWELIEYLKKHRPLEYGMLPLKGRAHKQAWFVYFKHGDEWKHCTTLFTSFVQMLPYIQGGIRVIIEFNNPKL